MQELKSKIINAITAAQTTATGRVSLYQSSGISPQSYKNEMLFFIKPEITKPSNGKTNLSAVLDLVFSSLEKFGMTILEVNLLGAQYMKESGAIASHYGVINRLSNNALASLSDTAKNTFKEKFGMTVEEAKPLGSFEFLRKFPFMNAESLDLLCQNAQITKLAGGTYCIPVKWDGQTHYLINAFHPRQLEHFVQAGRSIVTFRLVTNTDWSVARNDLIGTTNPEKANAGSLRRLFLEQKEQLGLEEVSQGVNGVHLSAGPIEGLAELCRFSGASLSDSQAVSTFLLGSRLQSATDSQTLQSIVQDCPISLNGKNTSAFEATEEKNTSDALTLMQQAGLKLNLQQAA